MPTNPRRVTEIAIEFKNVLVGDVWVASGQSNMEFDVLSSDGGSAAIADAAKKADIVGEAYPPYKDGLPDYVKLQNAAAPKKLAREFAISSGSP